jgi:hypothetical protein
MCEYLSFTGQLSDILLADVAAVYTLREALTSVDAKVLLKATKRVVFFVSWLSFECKTMLRIIMAECLECEDVCVYSATLLPEDDPLIAGLDQKCQYLPYFGRVFELQDVELLILPATPTCVDVCPVDGRLDEMSELLSAQLAGAVMCKCFCCAH